ncbi:hypothetical protein CHS0354_007554 [Potamilus streckersoni]|uniref:Concentrative nucleoside transporter N-terminal domain-containing protein n=1 Tax=Potamilus streckersoni TaxID=2493646 RepID=A0AAE0W6F5_9BIVA|nr:hypothetical protein CHS0354_007554 [Potamilus streckersoni]
MTSNDSTISEVRERKDNGNGVVATEKFEDGITVSAFNLQPMFEGMIEGSGLTGEETAEKITSPCRKWTLKVIWILVILTYCVYCGFAFVLNFERSIPLLVFNSMAFAYNAYIAATNFLDAQKIKDLLESRLYKLEQLFNRRFWKLSLYTIAIAGMLLYVILSNVSHFENLISLAGLAFFILISWVTSYSRTKINWRPVIWGLLLQLLLGLLILRTNFGRASFLFLGDQVESFLDHILAGVTFVFGDHYLDFEFAFKLMPIMIFLSSVFSVLYHLGVMQIFVKFIARVIHITMRTTAAETMCTAACIFLGQVSS